MKGGRYMIYIFTDASSYNNGYKDPTDYMHSSSSIVVKDDQFNIIDRQSNMLHDSTIAKGEAFAMLMALLYAQRIITNGTSEKFTIVSDSKLCVCSIKEWAYNWERKNPNGIWYGSNKQEVKNQDILKKAFRIYNQYRDDIEINHIRGHIVNETKYKKALVTFKTLNGYSPSREMFDQFKQGNDDVDKEAGYMLKKGLRRLSQTFLCRG